MFRRGSSGKFCIWWRLLCMSSLISFPRNYLTTLSYLRHLRLSKSTVWMTANDYVMAEWQRMCLMCVQICQWTSRQRGMNAARRHIHASLSLCDCVVNHFITSSISSCRVVFSPSSPPLRSYYSQDAPNDLDSVGTSYQSCRTCTCVLYEWLWANRWRSICRTMTGKFCKMIVFGWVVTCYIWKPVPHVFCSIYVSLSTWPFFSDMWRFVSILYQEMILWSKNAPKWVWIMDPPDPLEEPSALR